MNLKAKERDIVFSKTNGRCFYCNKRGEEIDHFVSRKKYQDWGLESFIGSPNEINNLVLACKKCNRAKRAKPPEDFIGNSFICWSRWARANQRAGIDCNFPSKYWGFEYDSRGGWAFHFWNEYLREIGVLDPPVDICVSASCKLITKL